MQTTLFIIIIAMDPFRHGFHGSVPFLWVLRSSVPVPHNRYFCDSDQLLISAIIIRKTEDTEKSAKFLLLFFSYFTIFTFSINPLNTELNPICQ